MGSAQWSDVGMFLQTFMLLAEEAGLGTCPQEAWAMHHQAVSQFVSAPANEMLFLRDVNRVPRLEATREFSPVQTYAT